MDQSNWTNSDILVTASDHVVNYTCTVTSDDRTGDSTISILSNGEGNTIVYHMNNMWTITLIGISSMGCNKN